METIRIVAGDTLDILFDILSGGMGVTGQSPTVEIQRKSNGEYWDGAAWQAGVQSNNMGEIDATDEEGLYDFSFTFPITEDEYIVHKINTGVYAQDEYVQYFSKAERAEKSITDSINDRLPSNPADQTKLIQAIQRLSNIIESGISYGDLN